MKRAAGRAWARVCYRRAGSAQGRSVRQPSRQSAGRRRSDTSAAHAKVAAGPVVRQLALLSSGGARAAPWRSTTALRLSARAPTLALPHAQARTATIGPLLRIPAVAAVRARAALVFRSHCGKLSTSAAPAAAETLAAAKPDAPIAAWLFVVSGMIFGIVVLGGLTRLTESGLSMTDWRPQGSLPPQTAEEWEKEFARYKSYPEYSVVHPDMTVDEFKFIYYMEWGHRMWGRLIGAAIAVPLAVVIARRRVAPPMRRKLVTLLGLCGVQGLVGWWMVKSGLEKPEDNTVPRVSPYRLTTHLASAFVLFGYSLWLGMTALRPSPLLENPTFRDAIMRIRPVKTMLHLAAGLVALTIVSGGFVAGNDAGMIYDTYPKMGDEWIPSEILDMSPVYKNVFENAATVQFDHRMLALLSLVAISGVFLRSRKVPLPPQARRALHAAAGVVAIQFSLGIATVLTNVPVSLAATHQAGSMALFSTLLWAMHTLRIPRSVLRTIVR